MLFFRRGLMDAQGLLDKATLETITEVHRWTDALFSFKTTRHPDYRFAAGQYARLGLPGGSETVWRAYSIVSAPHEDCLEYYGVLVPGGAFTTMLKDIKPGDTIWTEKQSYGFMTPDRFADGEDLWMLATGTGLGPFVSILRDAPVWKKFRRLLVVHCVKHVDEFGYQEQLFAMRNGHGPGDAELKVIQSVTRQKPAASGRLTGRITTLLNSGELEQAAGVPITAESSRIMLCGNPEMIEETRRILHQRGLRPCRRTLPGQFVTENYW
jgi:ferredoxin--NADP+ reductase